MAGSNTTPQKIVDKNGKETTVHRGRKPKTTSSDSRVKKLPNPNQTNSHGVKVGSEFSDIYADSVISFTVAEIRGDVVIADAGANEWGITTKPFAINDVARSIAVQESQNRMVQNNEQFWQDVEVGATYHYENFPGQYVRGVIAVAADGEKKLIPTALVGDWASYDLPSRGRDGEIRHSFHTKSIVNGDGMQPHMSNIWENKKFSDMKDNPRYMKFNNGNGPIGVEPLDISVPDLTETDKKEIRLEALLSSVGGIGYSNASTGERIEQLRSILQQIDNEQ